MSVLVLSGADARMETASEIAALSAETEVVSFKARIRGDMIHSLPAIANGARSSLLRVGSTPGGAEKAVLEVGDSGSWLTAWFSVTGAGGESRVASGERDRFDLLGFTRVYGQYTRFADPTGLYVAVYHDDGTLIAESTGTVFPGIALPAGGYVSVGTAGLGRARGGVDGLAIYTTRLTGSDRWSTPAPTDAGLVGLWTMDAASGDVAASAIGGPSLVRQAGTLEWEDNASDPNRWGA